MLRLMPRPLQFAFQSAGPQPARSLSGRLCRDASSPLPPSPDVGKFIRGAAFPIARAGLRRPLMRSAVECSRPAALFRAPDGLSARPGMSPPRAAGCIPAPATNRPHRTAPEVRPPPGRRSCDRTALRKPPPRPDAEAPRLRGDRSACGSCGDASRSPEARSSHGRSPPLSPESCGTPAPCGCSPIRKRLRTKHRTGAVSPPRNSHIRENPGSAERTERGGRAASVAERKIRMLRDAESPGEARKAPPRRA